MNSEKYLKDEFIVSTEKSDLDIPFIHEFLTNESGWSNGIPYEYVEKSIENSLNFGLFHDNRQIGYARVISDYSTIAYLGDVFIITEYRGLGLSKWLMEIIMNHKELQNLRRWILVTSTAEWLYEKYGFTELIKPGIYMEKLDTEVYKK